METTKKNFFISYANADKECAKWIRKYLTEAKYTSVLLDPDHPGDNFIYEMHQANETCEHTLAIISPDYEKSRYCPLEWTAALSKAPNLNDKSLLLVRICDYQPKGLLSTLTYIDLVGCDDSTAKQRLLAGVKRFRGEEGDVDPTTLNENAVPKNKEVTREFLPKTVTSISNPYKFLSYFDISDADNFYGRDSEIKAATGKLKERMESEEKRNIIRIVGNSGSGKSSFLRAGLLADLERGGMGTVKTVRFQPSDFPIDRSPKRLFQSIFDFLKKQAKVEIAAIDEDRVCRAGPKAAQLFIELLQQAIEKDKFKLIVGVDQFEEIIDDLQQNDYWKPLIELIDAASQCRLIGVVYTLESSRKNRLKRLDLPKAFDEKDEIEIDNFSESFIGEIVEKPFKAAGYSLSPDSIEAIKSNVKKLKEEADLPLVSSLLPLVALGLSKLFEYIQKSIKIKPIRAIADKETSGSAFDQSAGPSPSEVSHEAIKDHLDFDEVISDEVQRAWEDRIEGDPDEASAIDFFLHPFVGIGGENFDQIQLQTMESLPPYPGEQRLAESFKQHGLLIRTPNGYRLTHKAIIEYWPNAQKWLKKKRGLLRQQAKIRLLAQEWNSKGRPTVIQNSTKSDIDWATRILYSYLRDWPFRKAASDDLSSADECLREYCLSVFRQSKTPKKRIEYLGDKVGPHVYLAASYGMDDLLDAFYLKDSSCLNELSPKGRTTLHAAAWCQATTVKYLLGKKVNPALKDGQGWLPIAASVMMDKKFGANIIFKLLLEALKGQSMDCPNSRTLLHLCAQYNRVEMARSLVEEGISPDQRDKNGWLPIHVAAGRGNLEAVKYFASLSSIGERNSKGWNVMHFATAEGHYNVVEYLLDHSEFNNHWFDETIDGETALHVAARYNQSEIIRLLPEVFDQNQPVTRKEQATQGSVTQVHNALDVASASEASLRGLRPLHLALDRWNGSGKTEDSIFKTVRALLDKKQTDPNVLDNLGNTPLAYAARDTSLRNVLEELLRDQRVDLALPISKGGDLPLAICIKEKMWGTYKILRDRLSESLSGIVDGNGNTLLHLLVEETTQQGQDESTQEEPKTFAPQEIVEAALSTARIADLNTINKTGITPLMIAINAKNWWAARQLLMLEGINPLCYGPRSTSPLVLALGAKADDDILRRLTCLAPILLVKKDYLGWTPLHRAIFSQQRDWITWLTTVTNNARELWEQTDDQGRRPANLSTPSLRKEFDLGESVDDRTGPQSWDSGISWKLVKATNRASLIKKIKQIDGGYAIGDKVDIHSAILSFYNSKTVKIIRIKLPTRGKKMRGIYYLRYEGNLHRLDGRSNPIHILNKEAGIILRADNVLDYLRFFCFFVRGQEGPFLIAEGAEQKEIPLLRKKEIADLRKVLQPAILTGYEDATEEYLASASIYYSNSIFFADFAIHKTGLIVMIQDYPVIEGLSSKVNEPLT